MDLVKLTEAVYYCPGPTNTGVILCGDGQAAVIDPGIDQQAAKKLLKALEKEGLSVCGIINTHSHADHIGANQFLQSRCGAPAYASAGEAPFIANPAFEPLYLLGGASPWKEMRNKFLCAPPSKVSIISGDNKITLGGAELEVHPLPGHSFDQIGVSFDGVLFCGDAFLAPEYLKKHVIPYNVDVQDYLLSLEKVLSAGAAWTVPGHGQALEEPVETIEENRKTVLHQVFAVLELVSRPATLEEIIRRLAGETGLSITSPSLFFLYRTTVTAYLSYLYGRGMVDCHLEDNSLYWVKK